MQTWTAELYQARRARLLAKMPQHSAVLLFGARAQRRNADVHFPFYQDSYFRYFAGFVEENALMLLVKTPQKEQALLFLHAHDPVHEQWQGRRMGQERACARYGFDRALTWEEGAHAWEFLQGCSRLYALTAVDEQEDARLAEFLRQWYQHSGRNAANLLGLSDARPLLAPLRHIKAPEELDMMRRAAEISAQAHVVAMQQCKVGMFEYEIQALIEGEFMRQGATWAYPSIVAGGENSCILHYPQNDALLRDGDVLMIDAGCSVQGYAADISRTFPVNGRFSAAQEAIYEVVLAAQAAAIAQCVPGKTVAEHHNAACRVITQGLIDLGLLNGEVNEQVELQAYRPFYMHGTGHWLGMDVHDVGAYAHEDGSPLTFQENMVITTEPGIYCAATLPKLPERWHNIGVRIEDDVRVAAIPEILTVAAPKAPRDIEQLMRHS